MRLLLALSLAIALAALFYPSFLGSSFFDAGMDPAIYVSLFLAICWLVLFAVGAAKTIITTRSWWRSGIESMLTGIAAGAVTYGAGRLFGGPH